jgi:chromosome segregation ATPase
MFVTPRLHANHVHTDAHAFRQQPRPPGERAAEWRAQARNTACDPNQSFLCALQAAAQAANSEAEAKIASLTTQLSTAQTSCADAHSQLQKALTDFASKSKATEEQHHAALAALQLQLSDKDQQLHAAAEKEAECTAAVDEAAARILAQESDINMLNVQLAGKDKHA